MEGPASQEHQCPVDLVAPSLLLVPLPSVIQSPELDNVAHFTENISTLVADSSNSARGAVHECSMGGCKGGGWDNEFPAPHKKSF